MVSHEPAPKRERERRDSLLLVLFIILLGFLCILLTSGWALRFAPSWRLPANMGSNLDPNSIFLTSRPVNLLEPIDPAILTNPPWFDIFLTPGAIFNTSTPLPQPTLTPVTPVVLPSRTHTPVVSPVASPTSTPTLVFIPNTPTRTPTFDVPPITLTPSITLTPTITLTPSNTPIPQVDLQVTKTDGLVTYAPGSTVIYTVIVSNNGPSGVIGAQFTDVRPTQVTSWTWTCGKLTGGASGCDEDFTTNPNPFTDTVNLPSGASIEYRITAQISATATGDMINTATIAAPLVGYNETNPANNSATDTDQLQVIDMAITKTDGMPEYSPGGFVSYTITVANTGNVALTDVTLSDPKPSQVSEWAWSCNKAILLCSTSVSTGDFTGTFDLTVGESITFTVLVNINSSATGPLVNTATATLGTLIRSAQDTDTLDTGEPELGPPDGGSLEVSDYIFDLGAANALVHTGAETAWDFVFFERWVMNPLTGAGMLELDCVEVQVGQSATGPDWYTVLFWCDGNLDDNTNVGITFIGGSEFDNRVFPPPPLYVHPFRPDLPIGVAIDIDAPLNTKFAPIGNYQYIRFIQPPMGGSDGPEIDSILLLP